MQKILKINRSWKWFKHAFKNNWSHAPVIESLIDFMHNMN